MTRSSSKSLPALPTTTVPPTSDDNIRRTRRSWVTNNCIRTTVTLIVLAAYVAWTWPWHLEHWADATREREVGLGPERHRAPPLGVPKSLQTKWAQYSPWHPIDDYSAPPAGCEINQVSFHRLVGRWTARADSEGADTQTMCAEAGLAYLLQEHGYRTALKVCRLAAPMQNGRVPSAYRRDRSRKLSTSRDDEPTPPATTNYMTGWRRVAIALIRQELDRASGLAQVTLGPMLRKDGVAFYDGLVMNFEAVWRGQVDEHEREYPSWPTTVRGCDCAVLALIRSWDAQTSAKPHSEVLSFDLRVLCMRAGELRAVVSDPCRCYESMEMFSELEVLASGPHSFEAVTCKAFLTDGSGHAASCSRPVPLAHATSSPRIPSHSRKAVTV